VGDLAKEVDGLVDVCLRKFEVNKQGSRDVIAKMMLEHFVEWAQNPSVDQEDGKEKQ